MYLSSGANEEIRKESYPEVGYLSSGYNDQQESNLSLKIIMSLFVYNEPVVLSYEKEVLGEDLHYS